MITFLEYKKTPGELSPDVFGGNYLVLDSAGIIHNLPSIP